MDITFVNNQSFVWTLSLAQWALIYDMTLASFEMQIRDGALNSVIVYQWKTGATEQGSIDYEPTSKMLTITAPYDDMERLEAKIYKYDLQVSIPASGPTFVKLFAQGDLAIEQGVTR